jgi:hypothetical protein
MNAVWKVCFIPVFEGQDANDIKRLEDNDYLCLGVQADTLELAIKMLKKKVEGEDISEYIDSDESENWKQESEICEKAIIVGASFVSSIDVEKD